jgi:hypothetical protein
MKRFLPLLPALLLLITIDGGRQANPPLYKAENFDEVLKALPARNEGRFGRTGNSLNLLFLGSEESVSKALSSAGWSAIPRTTWASTLAGLEDLWLGRRLTRFPPMNDYRLGGRRQDMNWAKVVVPIAARHHFRLWRMGVLDAKGRELWWGHGDYDMSVRWIDLSHRPDPDMNAERDYISQSLEKADGVESRKLVALPQIPRSGANDKGYPFFNDGRALLVELAD